MTDREIIIKALENKKENMICAVVDENKNTRFITIEVVFDFITRQQAEIERLKKLLDDKCDRCIARDRAEAIKEFADLVDYDIEEKISDSIKEQNPHLYLIHQIVKDRLKEMVGEQG